MSEILGLVAGGGGRGGRGGRRYVGTKLFTVPLVEPALLTSDRVWAQPN